MSSWDWNFFCELSLSDGNKAGVRGTPGALVRPRSRNNDALFYALGSHHWPVSKETYFIPSHTNHGKNRRQIVCLIVSNEEACGKYLAFPKTQWCQCKSFSSRHDLFKTRLNLFCPVFTVFSFKSVCVWLHIWTVIFDFYTFKKTVFGLQNFTIKNLNSKNAF